MTNTSVTSDSIGYRVIATYAYDGGLFDMVYMPMVVEETVNLFSGQSETLRIFYKQGSQGGCPNQDSNITFDVLASNDSGTFYVGSNADQWNPQRVNPLSIHNASAISMATNGTLASNAPSIENPIDTHIFSLPGELQYEGQIWVVNPFTQSISTAITQPIPADINLLQFGDGILGESALTWQRDISAGQVEQITYTFQYLGAPGTPITFPSATMVLTEPLSNTFITIDAYPITFASSLPVVAEGHSPGRIVPGIMGSIPITVSNLLTDDIAIGSVALQITDTSGVLVYNDTQSFNLGPAVSQTLSFAWPTSLDKGRYITEVNLNYGSVKKIIFHDLIFVGLLPPQVTLASAPIGIVRPGDLISYTSRMTNTTGITLTNVIITATLPAGTTAVPGSISDGGLVGEGNIHWNFPELLQDQTTIVSFTVQINQNALDGKESDLVESEVWIESDRIFNGAPRATTWSLLLHPPPALTNIDPFQVPNNVSTTITIIGTGFLVTPTVTISSSLSLNATFVNSTTLTATVPAGLPIGVYTITVTNPDAQFSTLPSAITVYESVTAEFSGNPTSGTAPLTVNFTNLSTGNYDTCSWVFGDGITKKECGNPSHTYNTPGIYTVSLTMSGFGSSDVEVKEEYISISENYRVYLPIIIHDH